MSARKVDDPFMLGSSAPISQCLKLSANAVRIRRNGIEFRSSYPIPAWTEMTVGLQCPHDRSELRCTGVIVACDGNRHEGYAISMLFIDLSPRAQAQLNTMAVSSYN